MLVYSFGNSPSDTEDPPDSENYPPVNIMRERNRVRPNPSIQRSLTRSLQIPRIHRNRPGTTIFRNEEIITNPLRGELARHREQDLRRAARLRPPTTTRGRSRTPPARNQQNDEQTPPPRRQRSPSPNRTPPRRARSRSRSPPRRALVLFGKRTKKSFKSKTKVFHLKRLKSDLRSLTRI